MRRSLVAPPTEFRSLVCGLPESTALLLLSVSLTLSLPAQPPRPMIGIGDEKSCSTCRVAVLRESWLAESDGRTRVEERPSESFVDRSGRTWLLFDDGPPRVFARSGRDLALGLRPGRGPGEVALISEVADFRHDSVLLFDLVNARAMVLGPNLKPARQLAASLMIQSAALLSSDSVVVVTGIRPTAASAGWPIHLLDVSERELAWRSSFGLGDGALVPNQPRLQPVVLRGPGELAFTSIDRERYVIAEWGADGRARRAWARLGEWAGENRIPTLGNWTTPPTARVVAVDRDSADRLWVLLAVPHPDWRTAWDHVDRKVLELPTSQVRFSRLFRTRLEVLDLSSARLLASLTQDGFPVGITHGRLVSWLDGEGGATGVRIQDVRYDSSAPARK